MMWRRKETRGENHLWSTSMISGKWQAMDSQPKKSEISIQTWQIYCKEASTPLSLDMRIDTKPKKK